MIVFGILRTDKGRSWRLCGFSGRTSRAILFLFLLVAVSKRPAFQSVAFSAKQQRTWRRPQPYPGRRKGTTRSVRGLVAHSLLGRRKCRRRKRRPRLRRRTCFDEEEEVIVTIASDIAVVVCVIRRRRSRCGNRRTDCEEFDGSCCCFHVIGWSHWCLKGDIVDGPRMA